jgi:uncharacterized protein (TIGR04255 family)
MLETTDAFFPSSPRVIYHNCPLVEVICQLRFPPVLRIETAPPAELQERVRSVFPLFESARAGELPPLPPPIAQLMGQKGIATAYSFLTEDRSMTLSLSRESIALSTGTYSRWEDFRQRLQEPLRSFIEIYRPAYFSRIGLRYQDAIQRGRLGLTGSKWSQLLRPEILGELALPQFEDNLQEARRVIRVKFADGSGSILLQHGLGQAAGATEPCYVIDFDFSIDAKTEVSNAEMVLDRFNNRAGRAFRWCITDTLHRALGPREIGAGSGADRPV